MLVYTFVSPGYDKVRSDLKNPQPISSRFKDSRMDSKLMKILGYKDLPDEITVWCDANITIKDFKPIEEALKEYDMVVLRHPTRNCVYVEAEICKQIGLDTHQVIDAQMRYYRSIGYPSNNGLFANGIIARRRTPEVEEICQKWWAHISQYSWRDQLSLPVVAKLLGARIGTIQPKTGDFYNNEVYEIKPHLKTIRYKP